MHMLRWVDLVGCKPSSWKSAKAKYEDKRMQSLVQTLREHGMPDFSWPKGNACKNFRYVLKQLLVIRVCMCFACNASEFHESSCVPHESSVNTSIVAILTSLIHIHRSLKSCRSLM
jgi:hypothetical protein